MERRRPGSRSALWGTVLLVLFAAAGAARAQQVPFQRVPPLKARIENDLHRSRFQLGPIRLYPVLRISELGWTNNVYGSSENPQPDWTASIAAGLGFVLPVGHSVYFWGEEAPTYNWYAHSVERRYFGGTYGAHLAAFLPRLTVDTGAEYFQSTSILSSEVLQPVKQQERSAYMNLELPIFERFGIVGGGDVAYWRSKSDFETDQVFDTLDNDRWAVRGGLRYRFRGRLDVTPQVERTQQTFKVDGPLRDNESTAWLLGLGYDRPHLFVNVLAGYREGKAYNGSLYPTYHGPTGSGYVTWSLNRRLDLNFGGSQNLINSLYATNPYYTESLGHVGFDVHIGYRMTIGAYGELTYLKYPVPVIVDQQEVLRRDHGRTIGGSLSFLLYRNTGMTVRVSQSRYTSNIPGTDRDVFLLSSSIGIDAFLPHSLRVEQ